MDYLSQLNPQIRNLPVYQPGKPVELVAREFGIAASDVVKLASNENPLGPCPRATEAMQRALRDIWMYPDNSGHFLIKALADRMDLKPENFALGAGSNEIFYLLCDLFVRPGVEVVMGTQAFISYKIATILSGGTPVEIPMPDYTHDLEGMLASINENTALVFLPNPNNPTGTMLSAQEVLSFAERLPEHVIFCYDEAYAEYQDATVDFRPMIRAGRRIVATRTFSKIWGLAGLRLGYGYAEPGLAALINQARPPFNTGVLAQVGALAALEDDEWLLKSREVNRRGLIQLENGLSNLGLETVPSRGNFVLVRIEDADTVFDKLQRRGVIVRPVRGYGLPDHLRVSVGTEPQNRKFLTELESVLPKHK